MRLHSTLGQDSRWRYTNRLLQHFCSRSKCRREDYRWGAQCRPGRCLQIPEEEHTLSGSEGGGSSSGGCYWPTD